MKALVQEIEKAHQAKLFYLSLFGVLALPDIGGALESKDGRTSSEKYKSWYGRYVEYQTLSVDDAYDFRCSLLHQASSHPDKDRDYERIMFVYPDFKIKISAKRVIAGNRGAISVDLDGFISSILQGAKRFMEEMSGKEPFETNLKKCVSLHEKGIPPWIQGIPIIG